jgi:transcriptional regulator with XRE-family HTH domain
MPQPLSDKLYAMTAEQKFLSSFGKRLATIRKRKGITQEKLADIVEVHRTYIGFIEQGKRNPSISNVYKIAKALKVPIKDLFDNL